MPNKKIFIILAIFWLLILGGFIAYKEFTLRTGTEVLLKTEPVDPRDLFRGNYVTLRYKISTIDLSKFSNLPTFTPNSVVYAYLSKDENNYGNIVNISTQVPDKGLFIKGKIESVNSTSIRVTYGIESYFISEKQGHKISSFRSGDVDAKVIIDNFGHAILKTVLLNNKDINTL